MMKLRTTVVLLVVFCLSGCSLLFPSSQPTVPHPPEQEILDRVLAHLSEKYDTQFDIYSNSRWYNEQGRSMKAYVAGTSQLLNFDVEVGFQGSDGLDIQDGYVGQLMKPLLRQRFLDVVNQYYPVAEAQARNPGMLTTYPDSMGVSTTLDEFLDYVSDKLGYVFAGIYLSIPEGESEDETAENLQAIVDDLRQVFPGRCFNSVAFTAYTPQAYEESVVQDPLGARDTNSKLYQWSNESFEYYWTAQDGMRKRK